MPDFNLLRKLKNILAQNVDRAVKAARILRKRFAMREVTAGWGFMTLISSAHWYRTSRGADLAHWRTSVPYFSLHEGTYFTGDLGEEDDRRGRRGECPRLPNRTR